MPWAHIEHICAGSQEDTELLGMTIVGEWREALAAEGSTAITITGLIPRGACTWPGEFALSNGEKSRPWSMSPGALPDWYVPPCSCGMKLNLDYLLEMLWEYLALTCIYTKKRGRELGVLFSRSG
jgi:hypothetical protein